MKTTEEILAHIDTTLDQLIANAKVLDPKISPFLFENELEALQKMQESLLAHFLHMGNVLTSKKKAKTLESKGIQSKLATFSRLNQKLIARLSSQFQRCQKAKRTSARRSVKPSCKD